MVAGTIKVVVDTSRDMGVTAKVGKEMNDS